MSGELWKYAALADLVYARPTEDDPIEISLLDYQAEGAPIEESNGFHGQIFKSNDSTEIVVAIRCTDFEDISLNGHYGDTAFNSRPLPCVERLMDGGRHIVSCQFSALSLQVCHRNSTRKDLARGR